ncbi:MAG: cyclic nucleotide-binding domain-containing protein [Myxococcota bacterium]|nr:cyclic nucleotide-binding domain-containing protein [Deltaproteobacteria bacterium]MDQ3334297.1 cyclic nucleotide-binding domain-containing protein [Myxococcota bacterium]
MSKLRELEKRLKDEPENLGLRVMVAGAMREAGRQEEAVEIYRSVAIAYREQGRSQQAIAVCRSILEIAPDDVRCHALLASLVAGHKGRAARDTANVYGDEIVLEVGTPPPLEKQKPAIAQGTRVPTTPPATAKAGVSVPMPARKMPAPRSSNRLDETPLPVPMPYHVADPTTRGLKKLSEVDLLPTPDPDDLPVSEDAKTRPGSESGAKEPPKPNVKGIAAAARRISNALITSPDDLSAELDTRQRPRIESGELEKITQPPPTVPIERLEIIGDDDETAPPSITRNMRANAGASDTEEEDEGVPTLSDEDQDEPTRPRDTPLDLMIRTENEGPLASAFFGPLPHDKRDAVLARFHKKSVKKGTTVIRQGEVGHSLVVVVKGQLDARVDRKGGPVDLGAVGTGEFVGEGSLLSRTPSPVQVVAASDCELLLLTPRDFYEIAGAFPALWAELKDVAERRKRELELHLKR